MSALVKEIFLLPFEIIGGILEAIAEKAIEFCPPLIIFFLVLMLFTSDGCLPKIFGVILIPVGIIALIVWFIRLFV